MDIRQLRAFVAVAEEASFTRAADRLNLVQSSVSAAMHSLEAELGTRLIERTTRRHELTDAGRALLPEARRVLAAMAVAVDAVEQVGSGLRGSVSFGTMQAQAMRPMSVPRLLAAFRADHPQVEVSIRHVGGSLEMARHIRDGRLDLAVLSLPEPRSSGLETVLLASEPLALACPPEHRLARKDTVDLATLADETFVDFPSGWGTRMASDLAFAAAHVSREVTYELNDTAGVIEFVRSGLALALLPQTLVAEVPDVVAIRIVPRPPTFDTHLAWSEGRPRTAAVEALRLRVIELTSAPQPTRRR